MPFEPERARQVRCLRTESWKPEEFRSTSSVWGLGIYKALYDGYNFT